MWVPLIEFWSFWGVLLTLLLIAFLVVCAESESPFWGLFWFIVFLVVISMFTPDARPLTWIAANWLLILILIPVYVALGVVWAIGRWWMFVRERNNYDVGVQGAKEERKPLDPLQYKHRFTTWMVLWWADMLWFPISKLSVLYNAIYERLTGLLRRIAEGAVR